MWSERATKARRSASMQSAWGVGARYLRWDGGTETQGRVAERQSEFEVRVCGRARRKQRDPGDAHGAAQHDAVPDGAR
jgi:hypothetical protein